MKPTKAGNDRKRVHYSLPDEEKEKTNEEKCSSRPRGNDKNRKISRRAGGPTDDRQPVLDTDTSPGRAMGAAAAAAATTKSSNAPGKEGKKSRWHEEMDLLRNEMEIVEYARAASGNRRRKMSRPQSKVRTQKRRMLERQDEQETTVTAAIRSRRRLRGPKAAENNEIIQGSLVFGNDRHHPFSPEDSAEASNEDGSGSSDTTSQYSDKGDQSSSSDNEQDGDYDSNVEMDCDSDLEKNTDHDESEHDDEADVDNNTSSNDTDDDNYDTEEDDDQVDDDISVQRDTDYDSQNESIGEMADEEEDIDDVEEGDAEETKYRKNSRKRKSLPRPKRRLYRMRNFQSFRLAQRHGEALGAHARGRPKLAIAKLKQIATDAPSAPQIYSSLGTVYEDMLRECQREREERLRNEGSDEKNSEEQGYYLEDNALASVDDVIPDHNLAKQLKLAKKAYGAYHIAALLCKKDYSLWVRAADLATEIVQIHTEAMRLMNIDEEVRGFHRQEKVRWLSEAKNDYQTADNLKPPGIDVPAKLAKTLIDLGYLSEALTLLTDLKNRSLDCERSDFESSYKAWLLYAELMLRIGYECQEWNDGNQKNSNYMMRRWLRKFSLTFDWKERRLQALAKALEAAAGTQSCDHLIKWVTARVRLALLSSRVGVDQSNKLIDTITVPRIDVDSDRKSVPKISHNQFERGQSISADDDALVLEPGMTEDSLQSPSNKGKINLEYELEKNLLMKRYSNELSHFDKTTNEIRSNNGPDAVRERETTRETLIKKHNNELAELAVSYLPASTATIETDCRNDGNEWLWSEDRRSELPMSASWRAVCIIANELMRHSLIMNLYTGGRLAGEAVSFYMKRRATELRKTILSNRAFRESQNKPTNIFALKATEYDSMEKRNEDEESYHSEIPLSDDEDLVSAESDGVLETLGKGILPPAVRFLYGLCLAGEGGKHFLAIKCIESMEQLEKEDVGWLREPLIDTNVSEDISWLTFESRAIGPLTAIEAFSYLAELLNSDKLHIPASEFAHTFSACVERMTKVGIVDAVLRSGEKIQGSGIQRQNKVIRILLASVLCRTQAVEKYAKAHFEGIRGDALDQALILVRDLTHYASALWKVSDDGSIPPTCVDIVSIMARVFGAIDTLPLELKLNHSDSVLENLAKSLATMCSVKSFEIRNDAEILLRDLEYLPFPDSWLSDDLRMLSIRSYNCAVATNCSHFSGWEAKEFGPGLLRDLDVPYYFGVSLSDGHTSGYLKPYIADMLSELWIVLEAILANTLAFNFSSQLESLRATPAFVKMGEMHKQASSVSSIHLFGEEEFLVSLLLFAKQNLIIAASLSEGNKKVKLISTSLSIMLPISQFCLNQNLWTSGIGREATLSPDIQNWRPTPARHKNKESSYMNSKKRFYRINAGDRDSQPWFAGETDETPLSNVILIPPDVLVSAWNSVSPDESLSSLECTKRMEELDSSLRRLRCCFSEHAVETSCLKVAHKLIELAATPGCENPFACLQHASLFASQGRKGGSSGDVFKVPLPQHNICSPLECLAILGRAECLQMLYFYPEAAFLCSFVIEVCSVQRKDRNGTEFNPRWKIVSLLAYNQSVMLRVTANCVVPEHFKKQDSSFTWEPTVIAELKRSRAEGLAWLAKLGQPTHDNRIALIEPEGNTPTQTVDTTEFPGESNQYDKLEVFEV